MRRMEILSVGVLQSNDENVVILKETEGAGDAPAE